MTSPIEPKANEMNTNYHSELIMRALSRYGHHDDVCPLHHEANLPGDERCTCGFSAAMLRVEQPVARDDLLHAVNEAIDAMVITQRLFDLSPGHILMQRCRSLTDQVWKLESQPANV